jgi:hypothetical protein
VPTLVVAVLIPVPVGFVFELVEPEPVEPALLVAGGLLVAGAGLLLPHAAIPTTAAAARTGAANHR